MFSRKFEKMDWPQKLQHKMAFDRRPILTQWADKVAVRAYVAEKIGSQFLTEVYAITNDLDKIVFSSLPREFAFKPSHGSGAGVFIHESADTFNRLPVDIEQVKWGKKFHIHPDCVDDQLLNKIGNRWLQLRYESSNSWFEWVYQEIPARLIVEEYIHSENNSTPTNVLCYTFHGECKFIIVYNVFTKYFIMLTPEWEYIEVNSKKWPAVPREMIPPKPKNLSELLRIASVLSDGIDFVRVDLYNEGERILFSEMTNYPGAGRRPAFTKEFDRYLSGFWKSFDGY